MKPIEINIENTFDYIGEKTVFSLEKEINSRLDDVHKKTGKGSDFLGWVELPDNISKSEIKEIENAAKNFKDHCEIVVVIGIGGSYLGARAVIEALSGSFSHLHSNRKNPLVLYAGHNITQDYLHELVELLNDKSFGIIVISKSGTTTEPALAFRFLQRQLEGKAGKKEAQNRIVAVTDKKKGALRKLAEQENYQTFVIPDNIGGRYSVLTPVGLLPIATAGFDIKELVNGARQMKPLTEKTKTAQNPASLYAATRFALYKEGKTNEIMVNYTPKLHYFTEWWKQLYGESEGKEHKGIFPAGVDNTTDLHSMGQYIQEGLRNLFETVLFVNEPDNKLSVPFDEQNLDNLNYLAYKRVVDINKMAQLGTMLAHVEGGVPNILIDIPRLNENSLGQLIYFFEKACAISGYMLGVNPFDQPGVEAYKRNMFALLGKPGFEKETEKLKDRL
mgnify:CR=1 FL=1